MRKGPGRSRHQPSEDTLGALPATAVRVWLINHYADAPDRPTGIRHYSLARAVVGRGGQATIFAASFQHHGGREERLPSGSLLASRTFGGVKFVWLRTTPYRGNGPRRMLNMVSFAVMVMLAEVGRPAPDVVVGSTVHPFAALAAWAIAVRRRARFIYEIRDLWPQTMIDIGAMSKDSLTARMLYAMEAFLTRRADTVISVLPGVATYMAERGLPSDHVRYLPNGADLSITDANQPDGPAVEGDTTTALVHELQGRRQRGEVIFAYVGSYGRVNRVEIVLRALLVANARNSGPPIYLLLVGDGPEQSDLKELAEELGLQNLRFLEPIPKNRVPGLLAAADVGVVHSTFSPVHKYGISFNKLFDYMAAAVPTAFACSAYPDPIAESGAGLTIQPDSPEALGTAMLELAGMTSAERRKMGAAGRAYLEREHNMETIGSAFADIVELAGASPTYRA